MLPVNESNLHWWAAVVCQPQQALQAAPPPEEPPLDGPRVVCLDSAVEPPPKERPVQYLKGFMRREWCERRTDEEAGAVLRQVDLKAVVAGMKVIAPKVPKQENGFDCGVFVLEYLLHLLRRPAAFSSLGLVSHQSWFCQARVTHRRKQLRLIAQKLQSEAQKVGEPDVSRLISSGGLR